MIERENRFSKWLPTCLVLSVLAVLVIVFNRIDQGVADELLGDSGLIQSLTAGFLLAGALICLQRASRKASPVFKWAEATFLLVIYALREMDFHRRFTIEHVSNKKFYIGPDPTLAKVIASAIVLLTVLVLIHLTVSNMRYFFEQIRKRRLWAIQVILWAILLFGSQILDKAWRTGEYLFLEHIIEENMEFAASIFAFMIPLELSHQQDVERGKLSPDG